MIAQDKNRITIIDDNISVQGVFTLLECRTEYSIAYANSNLDLNKRLSLSLRDADVEKVLKTVLDASTHYYKIKKYHILILPVDKHADKKDKKQFAMHNINLISDSIAEIPTEHTTVYLLDEVQITGSGVNYLVDRISYLITDKMRSKAASAQDLLDQLPGVRYDKLSNSFRVGNETAVLLLVNGVQHSEAYIKNLPPERIQKIEIITEPSGRYLSESYSVIINLILKKGYSGYDVFVQNTATTNLAGNNGDDWLMNDRPEVNITYTKDKINVFANYGYTRTRWNDRIQEERKYTDLLEMVSESPHKPNRIYKYQANYWGGGINYQLAQQHMLSFQFDYAFQKYGTDDLINYQAKYLFNGADGKVVGNNKNRTKDNDYSGTFFYTGELTDRLNVYSDFTYNYYTDDVENRFLQNDIYHTDNLYTENKYYTKYNFEANYLLSSHWSVNAGYVNVWRKYDSQTNESQKLLDYIERRNKAFVYFSYKPDEKLSMKAGTALEFIDIKSENKNSYWSFQPYFQLNYKVSKNLNIHTGYTTNIYYPTLYQLSPLSTVVDSMMYQTGNPNLESALRHTLTVSFTFWNKLTIKPMFKYTPDRISPIYKKEDYLYSSTFDNIKVKQYVVQAIYEQPIGEYFTISNTFAYYYDKASSKGIKNSYSSWLWDSEINYYNPQWSMGAQIGYYRSMDKSIMLQGYQMVNIDSWLITLSKQFWNKQASLMLSYSPPLSWGIRDEQKKEINSSFYTECQSLSLKPYQNMLLVRFNLRFNNGKTQGVNKRSTIEREKRTERNGNY